VQWLHRTFGSHIPNKTLRRKSDGRYYRVQNVHVNASGDVGQAIRYHNARRLSYNGRVPNSIRDNEYVSDRMMLPNEALNTIASADPSADSSAGVLQKGVGNLKAGWIPALQYVRSNLPARWVRNAPNFSKG